MQYGQPYLQISSLKDMMPYEASNYYSTPHTGQQ